MHTGMHQAMHNDSCCELLTEGDVVSQTRSSKVCDSHRIPPSGIHLLLLVHNIGNAGQAQAATLNQDHAAESTAAYNLKIA